MGLTPRHPGQQAGQEVHVDARQQQQQQQCADFWTDDEEAVKAQQSHTLPFCVRFKFGVWAAILTLLVAAVVGLSVTMVILGKDSDSGTPPVPVDPEGGSGGGSDGSSGGNTGPLPVPPTPPFNVPKGSQAIWWDEFGGSSLDTSKWSYDLGNGEWGWGNNESQVYTDSPDNVRVSDGSLRLMALQDGTGYTSGRINTKSTASFYPGMQLKDGTSFSAVHVEARMQLPEAGQGLWPAFWMFPADPTYGQWAASGEIDIMESINDMVRISQGLHFGGTDPQNTKNMTRTRQPDKSPYSDGFHTFAADWAEGQITLSVDGEVAKTFSPREQDAEWGWWTSAANAPPAAPFNQPFYIIMNLAVGGLWPKYADDTTPFPATLTVDYVRVWGTPA